MNKNFNTLLNIFSFQVSNKAFSSYVNYFSPFLCNNITRRISYISFHNYFNLCPFITNRLFNLFIFIQHDEQKTLSPESFIEGLSLLYLSEMESRITTIYMLCDFDNDGIIKREDVKLLITHFHYLSNTSDVTVPINIVDNFFDLQSDNKNNNNTMTLDTFKSLVKYSNSDILYLFIFFLWNYQPFTKDEIIFYTSSIMNSKDIGLSSMKTYELDDYVDVTEGLFNYLNTTFTFELKHNVTTQSEINADLNDLLEIEEDFNQIKSDSVLSLSPSNNRPESDFIRFCNKALPSITEFTFESHNSANINHISIRSELSTPKSSKKSKPFLTKEPKHSLFFENKHGSNSDTNIDSSETNEDNIDFSSLGYIAFDTQTCDRCKIDIVGKMLFISDPHKNGNSSGKKTNSTVLIPIKQLFFNVYKSGKQRKKIMKTFIKGDNVNEMNTVQMFSGLNNFISFKLSFENEHTAKEFITIVERVMKFKDIKEEYEMGVIVGSGGFAKIKKATNKKTKKIYAVKIINKFQSSNSTIKSMDEIENMKFIINEVDVCQMILRINKRPLTILGIYGIYETFSKIYIVMDYIPSGSLEDLIEKNFSSLSLYNKYYIASQLVSSVAFLHQNNIMHRDIKAGNILVDKDYHIYLIDFGLSHIIGENEYTRGSFGTLYYAPPEMYKDKPYNKAIDIWSMGVVIYYLFYGENPFSKHGEDIKEVVNNIFNLRLNYFKSKSDNTSETKMQDDIIQVIKMCLVRDVKRRCNPIEIKKVFDMYK